MALQQVWKNRGGDLMNETIGTIGGIAFLVYVLMFIIFFGLMYYCFKDGDYEDGDYLKKHYSKCNKRRLRHE